MKKQSLLLKGILLLPIFFLIFSFVESIQSTTIDLKDGLNSKQIDADIISNGKHSGKSVMLKITNKTSKQITVNIPAGSAYMPADNGEQTLVQLEEDMIVLAPHATGNVTIAAFCSELSDGCPSSNSNFSLSKTTNKKLNQMITYMKGKKISKKAYQDAVWAITDGNSISNIQASDKVTKDFRKYVAKLMGKEDTWYTSPQHHQVDEHGNINSETVTIHGELTFTSNGTVPVHQEICSADGSMLYKTNSSQPRKASNIKMEFSVRVRGWVSGDYMVKIMEGEKELKRLLFKV